jgi:flavin reductase (DIM6/NTAB) family NADH-FMN oxidoreductase RutF
MTPTNPRRRRTTVPPRRTPVRLRRLPLSSVYRLLEPGPVVLLTTAARGRMNVMAMSWQTMVEFVPPLVACVVSRANHSRKALLATGECVIAIPSHRLAPVVVKVGNTSGRDVDKFRTFGLTAIEATRVAAPRIAECYANLECRVHDTTLVARYDLFILEVVAAWTDPAQKRPRSIHHRGRGSFVVDGPTRRFASSKP